MADDNTLANAGEVGVQLADALTEKITEAVDGFPSDDPKQKAAILRLVSNGLYDRAEEMEEG